MNCVNCIQNIVRNKNLYNNLFVLMASHFTNHGFYQEHVPQRLVYPKMQVVSSRKYSSKRKGERNNYIQNVCVCVWGCIYI
jgi:hypothetical protein